mgnify:CR=1 FL=1
MGVKDLFKCLKSRGLDYETIPVNNFKGQNMAVDIANIIHASMYHAHEEVIKDIDPLIEPPENFKDDYEPTSYLISKTVRLSHVVKIIVDTFILPLLQSGIFPIFVFDGESRKLKEKELNKRSKTKTTSFDNFFKERERLINEPDLPKKIMGSKELLKILKYCYRVTRDDMSEIKHVLKELGFNPLTAKHDGEELCCSLIKSGHASLVYSRDSDCLMYGIPYLITSTNTIRYGNLTGYTLDSVLNCLGEICHEIRITQTVGMKFKIKRIKVSEDKNIFKVRDIVVIGNGTSMRIKPRNGWESRLKIEYYDDNCNRLSLSLGKNDPKLTIEGLIDSDPINFCVVESVIFSGSLDENIQENVEHSVDIRTDIDINGITIGKQINFGSFFDYCVMLGTDYNDRIKGYGMVKAMKLIQQYKTVANISSKLNIESLNYHEMCNIFVPKDIHMLTNDEVRTDLMYVSTDKYINKYFLRNELLSVEKAFDKVIDGRVINTINSDIDNLIGFE